VVFEFNPWKATIIVKGGLKYNSLLVEKMWPFSYPFWYMELMLYAVVIHYYRHHGPNQNWGAPRFYTKKGP
jgi:hypothetical protein